MFSFVRDLASKEGPVIKEIPAKATQAYKLGQALSYASGELVPATAKPDYICAKKDFTAVAGDVVACYPVTDTQEWDTTFSVVPTDIVAGNKVTIAADFLQVTATTTSGVFLVLSLGGSAAGSKVTGMFK